jgi:hypothetical protein
VGTSIEVRIAYATWDPRDNPTQRRTGSACCLTFGHSAARYAASPTPRQTRHRSFTRCTMRVPAFRRLPGFAALMAVVAIACVTPTTSATTYKALPPKGSAADVEVFTDARPDRPHEELGVIDVKQGLLDLKSDYGKLILEARARAAQMGADAIIVTHRPLEHTTTTGDVSKKKHKKGETYAESTSTSTPIEVLSGHGRR